jgi:hypothetical protein
VAEPPSDHQGLVTADPTLRATVTIRRGMTGSDAGATGQRNLHRMLGLGLAIAALLGVAAAGGSVLRASSSTADAGDAVPYAVAGAIAGVAIAAIVAVAIRAARQGALRLRPVEILAAAFVAAAIGALLGVAFTPDPKTADDVSPLDEREIDRRREQSEQIGDGTRAATVDRDGDGRADVDRNGNVIVAYDNDGDGRIDGYLQPCPPDTPDPEPRPGFTPIDNECDGTVDEWLPFDRSTLLTDGPQFDETAPVTVPPEERDRRADEENRDQLSGRVRTILLLLLAVALCAAIITWLVRMPDRDGEHGDRDEDGDGPPMPTTAGVTSTLEASLDTMLRDPDPRAAICAAYGRMLDGFAAAGMPRRPEEAPQEHMQRCLTSAQIDPAPVRELLDLFAHARFSDHPMDELHRHAAISAMRAALDSVAGGAPEPAAVGGRSPDSESAP